MDKLGRISQTGGWVSLLKVGVVAQDFFFTLSGPEKVQKHLNGIA
jgi:hypothetical protein